VKKSRDPAALALLRRKRSEWVPFVAAAWRRESPQGGSQGCEPVRCQHTEVLSANLRRRAAKSQGRMPGDRCIGVAFLLVTFSLATQRKVTRSLEASEKRQGCRAPKECAIQQQSHWIPACAGTTSGGSLAKGDVSAARIMSMLLKNRSRSESLDPCLRRDDEWRELGERRRKCCTQHEHASQEQIKNRDAGSLFSQGRPAGVFNDYTVR
jgi:hypothetical protein